MKNKQLFACITCQMTDVIYLDGTETVNQVISMMDTEHKKTCPKCKSGGKFRVILKTEEAQQNAHLTGGGLCAKCGSPSWAHGAIGHDFIPPHPQVA